MAALSGLPLVPVTSLCAEYPFLWVITASLHCGQAPLCSQEPAQLCRAALNKGLVRQL